MEDTKYGYGPQPSSPLFQGNCSLVDYPNPYFNKPAVTWRSRAPFWYQAHPCCTDLTWPVGDPDDYTVENLPHSGSEKMLLQELEIERLERYLPGEVYRDERPKRAVEDQSKTAGCPKVWTPIYPGLNCEFRPAKELMNPPTLLEGVLSRKAETLNSYIVPETVKVEHTCEGVEDAETQAKRRPNFSEALKHADTRRGDFQCEPNTRVSCEDACKIPDPTLNRQSRIWRKVWRPSVDNNTNEELQDKGVTSVSGNKCKCGCKHNN